MKLMRASLDELCRRVYATPGRRMPEEVLREIAVVVSHTNFYSVGPWIKITSCDTYSIYSWSTFMAKINYPHTDLFDCSKSGLRIVENDVIFSKKRHGLKL